VCADAADEPAVSADDDMHSGPYNVRGTDLHDFEAAGDTNGSADDYAYNGDKPAEMAAGTQNFTNSCVCDGVLVSKMNAAEAADDLDGSAGDDAHRGGSSQVQANAPRATSAMTQKQKLGLAATGTKQLTTTWPR